MPRRQVASSRSPLEWGLRIFVALAALAVGSYSIAYTLSYTLIRSPERAHAVMPHYGRATAALSQKMLTASLATENRVKAERMAQLALRQDPTAIAAAATLGLSASLRKDDAGARQLFSYAEELSRRDLKTQLWAIEEAVRRDDVPGALRHYDIAMRTSRTAPDLLFPVLLAALPDPAIRLNLVKVLTTGPAWGPHFITYAAGRSDDPHSVAALLTGLRRARVGISPEATETAISRLIAANAFEEAWSYYASIRPGANRRASRDPAFAQNLPKPTLLDWNTVDDPGVIASIQRSSKGGIVDFEAPPSVGGRLLRQMQMLPPGEYRLEGGSIGIEQMESARPYWVLSCQDGRELGRVVLPNSGQGKGSFSGNFRVPAKCPVQTLTLIARPSESISGLSGQISYARLFSVS